MGGRTGSVVDDERFKWIEIHQAKYGTGVTAQEFADRFSISKNAASVWLSRWTNYYTKFRDIVQHFLKYVPDQKGGPGRYIIGPDQWLERAYDTRYENEYHDHHDLSGLDDHQRVLVMGDMLQTRTDKQTGKRTTAGIRTTKEKIYHIYVNGGLTVRQYAAAFRIPERSAAVTLSRWKRMGLLVMDGNTYKVPDGVVVSKPEILHIDISPTKDTVDDGVG